MLLKFTNNERSTTFNNGKGKAVKVTSRIHRKTLRIASKPGKKVSGKKISFGKGQKNHQASKTFPPTSTSLCDNSNDSGLGFDESLHLLHPTMALSNSNTNNTSNAIYHRPLAIRYSENVVQTLVPEMALPPNVLGKKTENVMKPSTSLKVNPNLTLRTENEDTCNSDDFSSFYQSNGSDCKSSLGSVSPIENHYQSSPEKDSSSEVSSPTNSSGIESPVVLNPLENLETLPVSSLHQQFTHVSRDGKAQLQIITQPEQQHRARYQTEGSRGAVKDRSGNAFPVVKLNGYNKSTTLQVFIGNDVGRVSPHIFYQACKVSGKNSTPCSETKTEGTMVIEIELKPENDMTVICDCVGILKERNVDVEHRLGRNHALAASVTRNKKKSTKCRIVFRAKINKDSEAPEILQICSNTITCTQPPGVPEICKKSLEACSVVGGKELFIIGKNFLKDTKVTFVRFDDSRQSIKLWEETVQPDKEYLQQTHLICIVPPYPEDSAQEPINVQIYVTSSNKRSEAHNFVYFPLKKPRSLPALVDPGNDMFISSQESIPSAHQQQMVQGVLSISWDEPQTDNMMPPPLVMPRKASFSKNLADTNSSETPIVLKTEFIDQTTQHSPINGEAQAVATSSQSGLQASVKQMIYSDRGLVDVTGMQNPFDTQDTQAIIHTQASSQVQDYLDGFKIQSNDLHHIKNEHSPEPVSTTPIVMLTPPPPQQELNSAQQQQVVENFLNLIVNSSVINDQNLVVTQTQGRHHHMTQDIILNSPSTVTTSSDVVNQQESLVSSVSNMIINNAISPSTMMCETNMITEQMVQDEIDSLQPSIETTAASSIVSNAVSDATAETQKVMKQMIAQAAAEILSENPAETQSSINNFISNTLGTSILTPASEQQQISSTQHLQEMLVQELNAASLMEEAKKEDAQLTQQSAQENLINPIPVSTAPATITQPFSPTTQDLTAMSESDLISFINPSVFM